MSWKIEYIKEAQRDLQRLDPYNRKLILRAIEKLRRAALTEETYERHSTFLARCHRILIRYIGCNIFDAMIIGTINAVFMLLTGMEYIALISLVVGVTNLLPTFGPIIGGAIGAFILVLIDPMHALIFIVFTLVLQTFDGYILKPITPAKLRAALK